MSQEEKIEKEAPEAQEPVAEETAQSAESQDVAQQETAKPEDEKRHGRHRRHEQQLAELQAKVDETNIQLAEMKDKFMRVYSEYENYRKRTTAEKAELILNGGKDVIKAMLPVIDDMERALANLPDDNEAKEGMQLVYKNMMNALQQKGLKPMEAMGAKFDENFHEAITQVPAPTPEAKGTVLDVVKKGYFLHEEVLRYAQVVVAC